VKKPTKPLGRKESGMKIFSKKEDTHRQFEQEMMPYMDVLYNYAYYLSGDREAANDLVQDTYMKAYRFYGKFEKGTNAKAWLYRIMKNTYINDYRRVHRLPEIVEYNEQISAYQMLPQDRTGADDLYNKIDRLSLDDDVAGAIAALPEKFKSVIVLRDIEDLPYEEIAELLEIPIGTVRSRLHRARSLLFDRLKGYAQNRGYAVGERFVPAEIALAG
jgi:RNA polymerase sigma-70 factor (ECF subfamily)